MCCPNSFRSPPPPLVSNRQTWKKKSPKPSWQALTPLGKRGKKVPQNILASLYTPFTVHMETRHFKKGLPLFADHIFYLLAFSQKVKDGICEQAPKFWFCSNHISAAKRSQGMNFNFRYFAK